MKRNLLLSGILIFCLSCSEREKKSELKPLLTDQLKYSHTDENWFVPTKIAIDGLTSEQINFKDSIGDHSIAELVSHLTFWNEIQLRAFKGEDFSNFEIDNDTTFIIYTEEDWKKVTTKLDSVQTELLKMIENENEDQLSELAYDILNIASHNAYHSGQIIFIRKQNGWWNRK